MNAITLDISSIKTIIIAVNLDIAMVKINFAIAKINITLVNLCLFSIEPRCAKTNFNIATDNDRGGYSNYFNAKQ